MGCGAYLSYLLRERVGKWDFSKAFPYWKIEKGISFEEDSAFTKFSDVLSFPKITVKEETLFKINNGQGITRNDISKIEAANDETSELFQILSPNHELIAIYSSNKVAKEENKELILFPMRVFHKDETD